MEIIHPDGMRGFDENGNLIRPGSDLFTTESQDLEPLPGAEDLIAAVQTAIDTGEI